MKPKPIEQPHSDWLARSYVCGYFASTAMLFVLMVAFMAMLLMSGSDAVWAQRLTENTLTLAAKSSPFTSITLHFVAGLLLATGYGAFFHDKVKGPSWQKGLVYSMGPFLISVLIFFPMVGAGLLGFQLGAGPLPLLGNLILHAAYGVTLGVTFGFLAELDSSVVRASTKNAALGLTAGGFLGAAVAWMVLSNTPSHLGISQVWVQMSGALVGSALGCLVGVVSGQNKLSDREVLPV